jgi:hypothetical protein
MSSSLHGTSGTRAGSGERQGENHAVQGVCSTCLRSKYLRCDIIADFSTLLIWGLDDETAKNLVLKN